jgi:hypothetical protein
MLLQGQAILAIVDVQGKLAQLMHDREALFANLQRMVRGAQILELPILWAEQNPRGLGPTIPELTALLVDQQPHSKMTFSCLGSPGFAAALERSGRKQVLLAGIEAHICVYNTAADLLARGFEVHVVADAVSARVAANREVGIRRMCNAGAVLSSVEMALFEMMQTADHPRFRDIQAIVK